MNEARLQSLSNSVYRAEMGTLTEMLDAVDRQRGRVIEVAGDPGAGKTRFVAALVREAERRKIDVLVGRCSESEKGISFNPFVEILRSRRAPGVLDKLPAACAEILRTLLSQPSGVDVRKGFSESELARLKHSLHVFLAHCASSGILAVLDDFQHADTKSVEFLDHLARFPIPRLLLVVAHRQRQASARLRSTLSHGVELGTVERVRLGPLSVGQSAEILGMAPDDRELRRLHRQSGGVPAYLLALAQVGNRDRPNPMGAVHDDQADRLLGEVEALDTAQHVVLKAAAVIGDRFDLDTVAAAAQMEGAQVAVAVSGLMARDLVRQEADSQLRYTFRHSTVRRAVRRHTDPDWRGSVNRRILEVLLDRNAHVDDLCVYVERLLGRPRPDDLGLLSRALERVIVVSPVKAVRWLELMVKVTPSSERYRAERAVIRLQLARVLVVTGQAARSRDICREVLSDMPGEPREVRAAAVVLCVQLECALGGQAEAGQMVQQELDQMPPGASAQRMQLMLARAYAGDQRDTATSRILAERCLRLAISQGSRTDWAGALIAVARDRLFDGDVRSATEAVDACVPMVDRLPHAELAPRVEFLATLGWVELYLDRFADAERHFLRGRTLARSHGHHHHLPSLMLGLSTTYSQVGRLDEAMRAAVEADLAARDMGAVHMRSLALACQSTCATAMDGRNQKRSVDLAERSLALLPADFAFGRGPAMVAVAEAVLEAGEPHRCMALMQNMGDAAVPLAQRARCLEVLAAAAAMVGAAAADAWAAESVATAARTGVRSHRGFALGAQAHALRAKGHHRRAKEFYREAARVFAQVGMDVSQARMTALAAQCAMASGARGEVPALLALAEDLARRSGAWRTYEHVRALRWELDHSAGGEEESAEEESGWCLLTAREAEIARLAGSGERTKDIALRLSLSPRTVEAHLTHIYRKLQVKSRAQLASWISERSGSRATADGTSGSTASG
ncbi:AAA family ATPase [Streptomyces sp. NBC_00247]|uniref:helix-turn-helix transcriptional regulator n=1 Tax=Streptomyces sp. NBC_00247 TaxID=2975689 RepID=UPI002E2A41BC|nr:AAA family ATPase [Streptomyces sp. NBC_00247]